MREKEIILLTVVTTAVVKRELKSIGQMSVKLM